MFQSLGAELSEGLAVKGTYYNHRRRRRRRRHHHYHHRPLNKTQNTYGSRCLSESVARERSRT